MHIIGFGYHPRVGYYPICAADPMPKQPPLPSGFIRWPGNRHVTKIARGAAVTYLTKLPMGGVQTMTDEDGTTIAAFKEWHFDNHPKGGGDPFWHPGISMLVKSGTIPAPTAAPVKTAAYTPYKPTTYQPKATYSIIDLPASQNPFAGERHFGKCGGWA